MSYSTLDVANSPTETGAAFVAGVIAAEPKPLGDDGRFFTVIAPENSAARVIDLDAEREKTADHPTRKMGSYTVRDGASFINYVERHGTEATELWADPDTFVVAGVIDGHSETTPGFHSHKVTLALRKTPEWEAWAKLDRTYGTQVDFAEHIEEYQHVIADPTGAQLLELVTTLKVAKSADFESATRLSTGEVQFGYRETHTATAGKGSLSVPEEFTLALIPFHGSAQYKVTARLRYRLSDGNLVIGCVLDRPNDVLRAAFDDVASTIATDLPEHPLYTGTTAHLV